MPDKVLAFYIRLSSEDRDLKTNALKNDCLLYTSDAADE